MNVLPNDLVYSLIHYFLTFSFMFGFFLLFFAWSRSILFNSLFLWLSLGQAKQIKTETERKGENRQRVHMVFIILEILKTSKVACMYRSWKQIVSKCLAPKRLLFWKTGIFVKDDMKTETHHFTKKNFYFYKTFMWLTPKPMTK